MSDHTLEVRKFEGDITNRQVVAVAKDEMVQVMAPSIVMSKTEALVHAAWLVALADQSENYEEFRQILKAVLES